MPPYRPGEEVVWLSVEDDGVRVRSATVLEVKGEAPEGRWAIRTDHGIEVVNNDGVGNLLLPMEDEIAKELYTSIEGYVVEATQRDPPWEADREQGRGGWEW